MRLGPSLLLGSLVVIPTAAFAAGDAGGDAVQSPDGFDVRCDLQADPDDVVRERGTVVIDAGRVVKDVIALRGDVVIRRGAKVRSAVALHGSVIVEDGATVADSLLSLGGDLRVAPAARVGGSRISLGRSLRIVGADGGELKLDLEINGESLGRIIVAKVLEETRACRIKERTRMRKDAG